MGIGVGDTFSTLGAYLLLVLPGILITAAFRRERAFGENLLLGNLLGISLVVHLGHSLGRISLEYFPHLLAALYVVSALALLLRRKGGPRFAFGPVSPALLILLLLVFSSRYVPLLLSTLPPGIDPSFHLVIAKKIAVENALPRDWHPFESIPLSYSTGLHLFLAMISRLSGAPLHQVFKMGFPMFAVLTTALIYGVARSLTDDRRVPLFAAAAYAFLAVWGSVDYYRWGGLPNLTGQMLLLGVVWIAITDSSRGPLYDAALLLSALALVHNHGFLVGGLVLVAYLLVSGLVRRRPDPLARRVGWTLAISVLLSAPVLVGYFQGLVGGTQDTALLRFYEPLLPIDQVLLRVGVPFSLLALIGLPVFIRRISTSADLLLLTWFASLFTVFVFLEYVYRFLVFANSGEFYTALTPSRFATDTVYPLSIPVAFAFVALVDRFRRKAWGLVALLPFAVHAWGQAFEIERPDLEHLEWIANHTPENAFILNNGIWMPYVAWREGSLTALPASERRNDPSVVYKRTSLVRDPEEFLRWQGTHDRPVYRIARGTELGPPFREVHRTDQGVRVYEWRRSE
jgi:hypothetical protein